MTDALRLRLLRARLAADLRQAKFEQRVRNAQKLANDSRRGISVITRLNKKGRINDHHH
jgi:hypothetical protein